MGERIERISLSLWKRVEVRANALFGHAAHQVGAGLHLIEARDGAGKGAMPIARHIKRVGRHRGRTDEAHPVLIERIDQRDETPRQRLIENSKLE